MIFHYYHIYADGLWRAPLAEHLQAIRSIDTQIQTRVGIVGRSYNRAEVIEELPGSWIVAATASKGWEQVTLDALVRDLPEIDGPVLYAHTKGASNASPINHVWRGCMTRNVVQPWGEALRALEHADLVGAHWLTHEAFPKSNVPRPYFAGNYWWARPDYLRTLPMPDNENRHRAEVWVGQNQPVIVDRMPGWPGIGCKGHLA